MVCGFEGTKYGGLRNIGPPIIDPLLCMLNFSYFNATEHGKNKVDPHYTGHYCSQSRMRSSKPLKEF